MYKDGVSAEVAETSWKFAQALAEFEVPQELRSPPRAGPHLGSDPLQVTPFAYCRMVWKLDIVIDLDLDILLL